MARDGVFSPRGALKIEIVGTGTLKGVELFRGAVLDEEGQRTGPLVEDTIAELWDEPAAMDAATSLGE